MFLLILAIARVAAAAGIRAESDFAASGEFAYLTTDLQAVLLDDALSVGGGFVLISNWSGARYGLRVLGALDGEHLSLGLLVSYSPPQDRRGWLAGEPRLGGHLELGRVVLDGEVRVGLRRIDVATNAGGSISIDQVQVEAEAVATIDERWHVALDG